MAQRNPLDDRIKEKMEHFAPEPREAVWQNIQAEIAADNKWGSKEWIGVFLIVISIGFFAIQFAGVDIVPTPQKQANAKGAFSQEQPLPKAVDADRKLTQQNMEEVTADAEQNSPATTTLKAVNNARNNTFASPTTTGSSQPKAELTEKSDRNESIKENVTPIQNEKEVHKNDVAKTEEKSSSTEGLTPPVEESPSVEEAPEEEHQQGENVILEGRQSQRSKLLGIVTENAEKLLGIDTEYEEVEYDDHTKSRFSADFKLFKIKRTKTRKND